jgi:hypothetical protein
MVSFLAVGVKFRVAARFDSICVPPARGAPSCATSGRAEIPGLEEFMVARIQGFGNRAFAIGGRYRERAVRAPRHGRSGASSQIDATVSLDGAQCSYSGAFAGSSSGQMDCSDAKGIPLTISIK